MGKIKKAVERRVEPLVRRCGYCGNRKIKGLMHDTFSGFDQPCMVPICNGCLQDQYGGKKIKALSAPNTKDHRPE